jgi:crossover junction endodeoxyribonuclease RusA
MVQVLRLGGRVIRKRVLTLPWPPSVNHYWMAHGNRRYISKRGYQYREDVLAACLEAYGGAVLPIEKQIKVTIEAHPPDNRCRDLDNLLKAPLDALAKASVYASDYQIADLRIIRRTKTEGGVLIVTVEVL